MLEHRYTLSGITAAALDGPAVLAEAAPTPYDQELRESPSTEAPLSTSVPEIVNYSTHVDCFGILCVQGKVIDDDPGGMTVSITWMYGTDSTTTDSSGLFYWTTELEPGDEGLVTAVTWNEVGESETVEAYVEYPE